MPETGFFADNGMYIFHIKAKKFTGMSGKDLTKVLERNIIIFRLSVKGL
jgi:hypothetical protein